MNTAMQFLPLLVVLVIGVALAVWLRPRRAADEADGVLKPGVRGWLAFLAVSLWLGVVRSLAEWARTVEGGDAEVNARFPLLAWIDNAFAAVSVALLILCGVLLARKSARFPRVFYLNACWVTLSLPLSVAAAFLVLRTVYDVPLTLGEAAGGVFTPEVLVKWIAAAIAIWLWSWYVARSRRVAITCVE